jgi:hypothetical protein
MVLRSRSTMPLVCGLFPLVHDCMSAFTGYRVIPLVASSDERHLAQECPTPDRIPRSGAAPLRSDRLRKEEEGIKRKMPRDFPNGEKMAGNHVRSMAQDKEYIQAPHQVDHVFLIAFLPPARLRRASPDARQPGRGPRYWRRETRSPALHTAHIVSKRTHTPAAPPR